MKIRELIAILDRREMGRFFRDMKGRVSFVYDEKWRNAADAYPLSLSMPLTLDEHGNSKTDPFLWGLLPDNEKVLDRWGKKYQVSSRNAFGLITGVGEDCAGAVQFVRPDRLDAILGKQPPEIEWLTPGDIAQRLRSLREDHAAWRNPRDTGQFSLAGAQPKTALLLEEGRWGIPSGRTPTTHILKPPTAHFDGHAENEHFCLELGRAIGLPVANSEVMRFKDEIAIVIERYDRIHAGNVWQRVHQEDTCQALSIQPTRKYQSDGGPGVRDIVDLLKTFSSKPGEDMGTFLDAVYYNWLIAGTDAHAKNYALLIASAGQVRLAPLYDIASILPYPDIDIQKARSSLKIGNEYRLRNIGKYQWQKLAQGVSVDADALTARIVEIADAVLENIPEVTKRTKKEGLDHPLIDRLAKKLTVRVAACRKLIR
ncbi:MAG TPA: type II toxin-antitoxin system HipA family toxin [Candidatus Acidoferrales bacterium]|nr:type II toxin-antitoxin system HipA family toxin [Candidatus Acidoferrales bacterium]